MNENQMDKIQYILNNYTFEQQREIFIEECAEAVQAAQKMKRCADYSKNPLEHFAEEIADVLIMAQQMKLFLGESKVDEIIDAKLNRQIERIKNECE